MSQTNNEVSPIGSDALVLPLPVAGGWDIRIQCTVCGTRCRRHRNDHPGSIGATPKATLEGVCHVCTSAAGYPRDEVRTLHFIDYATDEELRADES
jgi:hypothetical protein